MKKNIRRWGVFLILAFIILLPSTVVAKEPTDKFLSLIEIEEDGSIKVRELIHLNGDYNGLEREINYRKDYKSLKTGTLSDLEGNNTLYDGSSIEEVRVGSISYDGDLTFDDFAEDVKYFTLVNTAKNGENAKYINTLYNNGVYLKAYNPSKLDEAFYIEYTITDAVVVHQDIAELAWNVLGEGYNENIDDFEVKVVLPGSDSDYRVWLHGPLNGYIERTNDKEALGTFDFLGAYNAVSVRLIFNKDLVPYATKYSNLEAKDEIIRIETDLADKANQEREAIQRANNILILSSIIWGAVSLILTIIAYSKERQSKKTDFQMEYYRDFPATYGPEVLEYLLDKNVTEKSLSATILNLIYKKVLKVEKIQNKKKEDYKLVLQEYDEKSLTKTEQLALNLIINEIGNSKEVILSGIKKHCSNINNAQSFIDLYNDFIKESKKLGEENQFFVKTPGIVIIAIIFSLLGVIPMFISFGFELPILGIIILILIFVFLFFIITRRFYTKKGALDYAKWMAHKRFLEDFSRFDEKELPEVILWDKYLVYATILGCADKLSKEMKIKVDTFDQDSTTYMGYDPFLTHYFITASVYSSINSGVHTAVSSSRSSIASSRSSSGGGFGGGSIGGGGSFGGGGGGGRF